MDLKTARSWATQPDGCRFCLAARGSCDVTVSYQNDGVKETIVGDMLQDCFGISLSHLHEWGLSRMVCDHCAEQLRNAVSFKQQVLDAELVFQQCFTEKDALGDDLSTTVKVEPDEDFEDANRFNIDYPEEFKTEEENPTRRKRKKSCKLNSEDDNITVTGEKLDTSNEEAAMGSKRSLRNKKQTPKNTEPVSTNQNQQSAEPEPPKPLSERKRMTITCQTVLTHTTACPFRHHKSWFKCLYCIEEFTDMRTLRQHAHTHADIRSEIKKLTTYPKSLQIDISEFKCRMCDVTLLDIDDMCSHLSMVHNKVVYKEYIADFKVDGSPYTCHLCGKEFHVFRSLTVHLNEHYANYICEECGKAFMNSKRLKVHQRTHELGDFSCKECSRVLPNKSAFANHVETHSKRVLKCQICGLPMKHYNDRIKHMSEVHNMTHTFKCHFCPKQYNVKHYLATHVRQTHGSKDKKCDECNMAFITNHSLKMHMAKHSGEKPFSCSVCLKTFSRRYTMKEHLKVHCKPGA